MSTLNPHQNFNAYIASTLHWRHIIIGCLLVVGLAGCKSNPDMTGVTQTFTLVSGDVSHEVVQKVTPPISFFSTRATLERENIRAQTKYTAEQVATTAIKRAKLEIKGPLILVFEDLKSMSTGPITADIGFPVKGKATRLPNYTQAKKPSFKCISLALKGPENNHSDYWEKLYQLAAKNGLKASGESRTVITQAGSGYTTELQLGVI